jgi:GNAT superfamily N-acetyltransferase
MDGSIEAFAWASELTPPDLEAVTAIFNDAWADWVPGERPITADAYVDNDRFTAPPERIERRLVRDAEGVVVAHGQAHWREGPGACVLRAFVDLGQRGRGHGRLLVGALVDVAREAGRTGCTLETAVGSTTDHACEHAGLRADMVVEQNRTATAEISLTLLDQWRARGESASGYSPVAYDAPCPDDDLAADFIHARHVMNDAPRWEGEPEATYTVAELRAVEAASAAARQGWWNVGIRHDASGELVGLSEMYVPTARPWIVLQGDTGVAPAHRGHGLGGWMKAINHLRLRSERPDVEIVQTWNASANEPMLRINRALGFQPVQTYRGWHLPFE